jgi:hypothetical protein
LNLFVNLQYEVCAWLFMDLTYYIYYILIMLHTLTIKIKIDNLLRLYMVFTIKSYEKITSYNILKNIYNIVNFVT